MPFTPSHAVVAIPLRRLGLPLGAVAVGAMTPDTAVFLPWLFDYGHTHSPVGVVTTDLAVGLVVVTTWWGRVRAPVVDVLPDGVRRRLRLDDARWRSRRWWASVVVGLVLGSVTHVVWDGFTHATAWGADLVPALREPLGPLAVTSWLQYASGVGGLAGIVLWWRGLLRRRSPDGPDGPGPRLPHLRHGLRALPVSGAVLGVAVCLATVSSDARAERVVVRAVTLGGLGALVGLLVLTVVWHAAVRDPVPGAGGDGGDGGDGGPGPAQRVRPGRRPRRGSWRTTRRGASTTAARRR